MAEEGKREIIFCVHCGNNTEMEMVASHKYEYKHYDEFDSYEGPVHMASHIKTWLMYYCPVCNDITLILDDFNDFGDPESIKTQLYPRDYFELTGVPNGIASAFQAAIKCRHVDGAICAIALRRTLEMICKERGVTTGFLGAKLKKMSEDGILPHGISDIAIAVNYSPPKRCELPAS